MPLAALAALAGILLFVAWNMFEGHQFMRLRQFSMQYRTLMVGTFVLTIVFDLTAQVYFADGNNEWPVVKSAQVKNPALDALGPFKSDDMPIEKWASNTAAAQKAFDRAGWR